MEGTFSSTRHLGSAYIFGSLKVEPTDITTKTGKLTITHKGIYKKGECETYYVKIYPKTIEGDNIMLKCEKEDTNGIKGTYNFFGDEGIFLLKNVIRIEKETSLSPPTESNTISSSWMCILV